MAELTKPNDVLSGERIYIIARSIDPPRLSKAERSGKHKRMETTARRDVICTIEAPAKWIEQQEASGKNK
jgi:hypothetical protein